MGGANDALRFDGVRFTPWSAPIASTPIRNLVSVRVGEFWIATGSGLAHVRDNVVISQYDLLGITAVYRDSDGSVWALSLRSPDRILCQATDTRIRCFGQSEGITIHVPFSFIPDGKGGFWIGGDTSLLHWKMGAAPEIYGFQQLQSNVGQIGIRDLLEESDGSLLVGILAAGPGLGLERFRNGVLKPVVLPNFDGSKLTINMMMEDSDKSLWIATDGNGIYRIHGQAVDHFGRADGLSSDTVLDLYGSDDGIVWAATSDGIDNFRDLPVTTFSASEGIGRNAAVSVMATKDGTVWVASLGTLDFIRNGTVSSVRVPGQQVSSLLEDHQGNMWVGIDDGLFIYKDGRFRRIPEPDDHPLGLVVGITEDVDGNIWAECKGTQRRLIHIRDFKVREEFSEPQIPAAKAIAADPKGGIWLGTLTGDLTFFREGIARTFPLKLKSKHWAYQIAVDPDGSVITASPDGLVMLRAGQVQRLGKENGLPCDGVTGFAVDDNKNLWLNTPCGYTETAASDVQRWSIHPDTIVQTRLFGTLDGALPGRAAFTPAATSPDGRLWFVNSVVLQMIDPSHLSGDGTVSPVYVESVVADRKQYKPQEGLQLSPLTRDLQIGYTSPSFLIPQKVKFRYRLDGHDLDWQDADTRRQAFYTDLGPGKYRFRVIACNNDGVWNEAGAAVEFSILPTFYQTTWFLALCIASTLTVLYLLYLLRLRQVAQLVRGRMETRLAERERIARDLHDTLLQGVQGLILKVHAGLRQIPTEVPGRQTIEKALDYGDQVVAEGRDRVRNLRSTAGLSDLSLAFQRVADEMRQDSSASVKTVVEGTKRELHPVVLEESYSIGREALVNALSHSEGQHVEVGIIYDPKQFRLRVRDDGRGIEPKILEKGSREGHWGLQGMRERAEKIGGQLEFWSRPGTGTEVELTVPAKTAYRSSAAKNKSA